MIITPCTCTIGANFQGGSSPPAPVVPTPVWGKSMLDLEGCEVGLLVQVLWSMLTSPNRTIVLVLLGGSSLSVNQVCDIPNRSSKVSLVS